MGTSTKEEPITNYVEPINLEKPGMVIEQLEIEFLTTIT